MRPVLSAVFAAICWSAGLAAAESVSVYLSELSAEADSVRRQALSPDVARCVLAQRAGVLDYHSATLTGWHGDDAIEAINEFGVHTPLVDEEPRRRRATILLEHADHHALSSLLREQRSFELSTSPSTSTIRALVIDLAKQADYLSFGHVAQQDAIRSMTATPGRTTDGDLFFFARDAIAYKSLAEGLIADNVAVTTIVPSSDRSSAAVAFGVYEMPGSSSTMTKRNYISADQDTSAVRRSADVLLGRQDTTYNGSLPGILPACFPSQSSCESITQNCTGHGVCAKKFTDETSSPAKSCYSCMCRSTSSTNDQGQKKTTYWAGPACQKRDVSSSFWLITLFTIGMVFVVGFAIGQIWTMGNEELPSVIGAGVSGPVRRS